MITYQSDESMPKVARKAVDRAGWEWSTRRAASRWRATSTTRASRSFRRFDANSYLVLSRAMDLHDVGDGRGGIDAALAEVDRFAHPCDRHR